MVAQYHLLKAARGLGHIRCDDRNAGGLDQVQEILDAVIEIVIAQSGRIELETLHRPDHLKASIAGETHEYTDMYPGMAKSAREEGFGEIADWFETLAKAEKSHAGRVQQMLNSVS